MPILPPEPYLYPLNLFDGVELPPTDGRSWKVLHTRPRQEKSLARRMYRAGVPFYLPLETKRTLIRGRPLPAYVPLFPSYLFVRARYEEFLQALATRCVVRTLEVKDQGKLAADLQQVFRLIASGASVAPEARLVEGATVEIRHGALAGLRGKIVRAASANRFVVAVEFLQRGVSIQLDDYYLEAVRDG
jgi:transcriptional antiterminator RfaH